ncbi:MAG: M20 family metallopeptidase [Candidatus Goldbacteria bacterium]|nr:M20 family metallopeptidase [Candidatus Goldiibacteriota bacterium]
MKPESVKNLLSDLVRIPSVNQFITGEIKAEQKIAEYLKNLSESSGLKTQLLEVSGCAPNLLITKEFKKSAPWIMFCAHMDTVSADGMNFDPFCGEEKNGRILGRGSNDDKGSIAAALWALKEVISEDNCVNNIALLFTVDEEQHRSGAAAFCNEQLPKLNFKPQGVVIAEPTSLMPIVAHAGIGHFKVIVKGIAAHASDPSKGRSAIKDMVKVMDAIEKDYIAKLTAVHPLCGKAQCSINMITGGRQINGIPDECIIRVDRRVMPGEDVDSVIPEVEKVLSGLRKQDPGLRVTAESDFKDNPLSQDLSTPFITKTLEAIKKAGLDSTPIGAAFATDAGAFSAIGLPCVVLGPGEDKNSHTADESIAVKELEEGVRVFKELMRFKY